jgi:hypothetical protein
MNLIPNAAATEDVASEDKALTALPEYSTAGEETK